MLVSLNRFKQFLDIKLDNILQDDLLNFILNQSTKIIENICNQNLIESNQTIYIEPTANKNYIILNFKETPIEIITSFKKDKCGENCSEWTEFNICEIIKLNSIYKIIGTNFTTDSYYKFNITQGFEIGDVPYDLQQICLKVATYIYRSQRGGQGGGTVGINSKSESSSQGLTYSASYTSEDEFYKMIKNELIKYTIVSC
ncbi:MAG: hypothetical protein IPM06_22315 [Rhizobiales bacterium]|nr:hypothetical protein [Hyphomicrobiales bacterium]